MLCVKYLQELQSPPVQPVLQATVVTEAFAAQVSSDAKPSSTANKTEDDIDEILKSVESFQESYKLQQGAQDGKSQIAKSLSDFEQDIQTRIGECESKLKEVEERGDVARPELLKQRLLQVQVW